MLITFFFLPSNVHPEAPPASSSQSNVLHLSSILEQSNHGFPRDSFTSLCAAHIHRCKPNPDEQSGGLFFTISAKCRAHSPHGYMRVRIIINSLASLSCLLVGSSGNCAANVCKNVHVARPKSSLLVFALEFASASPLGDVFSAVVSPIASARPSPNRRRFVSALAFERRNPPHRAFAVASRAPPLVSAAALRPSDMSEGPRRVVVCRVCRVFKTWHSPRRRCRCHLSEPPMERGSDLAALLARLLSDASSDALASHASGTATEIRVRGCTRTRTRRNVTTLKNDE